MNNKIQKFVEEVEVGLKRYQQQSSFSTAIVYLSDITKALALIKVMECALDKIENGDDQQMRKIAREARFKCMEILK